MAKKTDKPDEFAEREERIRDLQRQAEERAGEAMSVFESEEMSQEMREVFWENVVRAESESWVAPFDQLAQSGMILPPPDSLDDIQLTAKLWEMIHGLAMLRNFLHNTDHLSDRELYTLLWEDVLRDAGPSRPLDDDSAWHIDLVGSGSEDDTETYLRYYADEEERRHWGEDWFDGPMPDHENPPFDRDRLLPDRDDAWWKTGSLPA